MSKRFIISDESLNEYGFWLSTEGCDLAQFLKNPVMLWMHNRAWRGTKDEVLPIGHWNDIRKENGQITAEAVFDADEFSQSISAKVESGTLRMASSGLRIIEESSDPSMLKPGQTRATVTRWILKEASICDIGANDNAMALYDEHDNLVKLSDDKMEKLPTMITKPELTMKKVIKLFSDLNEDASEDQLASKVAELQASNKVLQDQVNAYELQRKTALKTEAETLTQAAVKDGRIDAGAKEHFLKMFDLNHDAAKAALSALKPHISVNKKLESGQAADNPLEKLSWDEIDRTGQLATLRSNHPDLYKEKFKEKFGHEPKQ